MSKPLFLTRQTKSLLGNLKSELKAGASISVLYGDPGTGKTRIMEELAYNQAPESGVHWVDLSARDSGDDSKQDRSDQIEAAFNAANYGDIIITDHFESAFQKTRHQLFLCWATAGVEKNLSLIIASNTEAFKELRQLALQYQTVVKNFQVMPLIDDEVEAFLGFYLFPDHPIGKLSMPGSLRVKFAVTHGNVGRIIDITERDGAQIEYKSLNEPRAIRRGRGAVVSVAGVFALVVAVGLFYLNSRDKLPGSSPVVANESSSPAVITESEVRAVTKSAGSVVDEIVAVPEIGVLDEVVIERRVVTETEVITIDEPVPEPVAVTESQAAAVVEVAIDLESIDNSAQAPVTETVAEVDAIPVSAIESEVISDADDMAESPDPATVTQEPGTKLAAVIVEEPDTTESASTISSANDLNRPEPTRFERQLQESMDWINRNDNSVGTIQILMLSFENFDVNGFYEHVDFLASQQVDISRLRVIKTYTGNRIAYSVFYGEYESWKAAGNSKVNLPEVLRKTSPIPRSVGGIMEEIRRLEAEN